MLTKIASKAEVILVAVLSVLLWFWLIDVPGREAHTDVLWYMNMGLNNVADPHWVIRYTHVYLQKIFLFFADQPFDGLKAYWAFLISVTAALIYFNARKLTQGSTILTGIAAVAIFFSFSIHAEYAGVALADMTSMLMVVLTITIFIQAARRQYAKPWVILLGFVLFLAFQAKETTWFVFGLVLGIGAVDGKIFDRKVFGRNLGNLGLGFLIGLGFFTLLNGIFLKDALFFFRGSTLKVYFGFWLLDSPYFSGSGDWYTSSILQDFSVPFILYLLSGKAILKKDTSIHIKLVWALPLFLIGFLSLGMLKNTFAVYPRFLFPGLALISIFAPQFIQFEYPQSRKDRLKFWGLLLAAVFVYYVFRKGTIIFANYTGMNYRVFIWSIVNPLVFTALLVLILWSERFTLYTVMIPALCLAVMFQSSILENYNAVQWAPQNGLIQKRFYPLAHFSDVIDFDEDTIIFVSTDIPERTGFLSDNIDTVFTIFNIYFKTNSGRENFILKPVTELPVSKILDGGIDYLFFSEEDWKTLSADPVQADQIQAACSVHMDDREPLALLDCR
jgi:hypothetical protein